MNSIPEQEIRSPRAAAWLAGGLAFAVALAGYVQSLSPTINLGFSGFMTAAADNLGVANPPGYPIWVVLGWGWIRLWGWLGMSGPHHPAFAMNLLSAVCGALGAGAIAWLAVATSGRLFRGRVAPWRAVVSGVSAALLFAWGGLAWSQAVMADVHTMNTALLLVGLCLLWCAQDEPLRTGRWVVAAFVFGCLAANSRFWILFAILPVLGFVLSSWRSAWSFVGLGLVVCGMAAVGLLSPFPAPFPWLIAGVAGLMGLYLLAQGARGRILLAGLLAFALGLAWLLFPAVASWNGTLVQWADAARLPDYLHLLAQGQYERIAPVANACEVLASWASVREQAGHFVRILGWQYLVPMSAAGGVGLLVALLRGRAWRWQVLLLAALLLAGPVFFVAVLHPAGDLQSLLQARVWLLPFCAVLAIYIAYGFMALLSLRSLWRKGA